MTMTSRKFLLVTLLLAAGLLMAACTRTASTQPVPTVQPGERGISTQGGPEATMEAVRSSILTQTAVAAGPIGVLATATQAVIPTATPQPTLVLPLPTVVLPTNTPVAPLPTPTPAVPSTYTVQHGEWMYSIARKFGLDPLAVIAANPGIDPDDLFPGQVINLPPPGATAPPPASGGGPTDYTVQLGDYLYSIARKFGVEPEDIVAANPWLVFPYLIYPGQVLHIP